jgi:hypothetical protein
MSFDLVVWVGSPKAPSQLWSELEDDHDASSITPAPERLVGAFRAVFGDDLRVLTGADPAAVEVLGRGWECYLANAWTTINCSWSLANEPTAIAALVRAAHAAGCSVYDPQSGAYWPVSIGLPKAEEDVWTAAVFDEGFAYENEDDEGHVRALPMRLCPDDVRPIESKVWLYVHVVEDGPLLRALVSARTKLYRERFPSWAITVEFGGPGAGELGRDTVTRWLKGAAASAALASRTSRLSVAFVVLGNFDVSDVHNRFDVWPFELVPITREEKLLASIFGEPVASLGVIVPTRIVAGAPEIVRAGLRALHDEIVRLTDGAPLYFADPSRGAVAPVGANIAWVEALVGLTPSEAIREIAAAEVPPVTIEDQDDDDDHDEGDDDV